MQILFFNSTNGVVIAC